MLSYWSETTAAAKSPQSCPTLCDPTDSSPPGSAVPGILQARTLEWVAISFSNAWKWKVKVKSLSRAWLLATPWTAAYQAPPSAGFSRQEWIAIAFSKWHTSHQVRSPATLRLPGSSKPHKPDGKAAWRRSQLGQRPLRSHPSWRPVPTYQPVCEAISDLPAVLETKPTPWKAEETFNTTTDNKGFLSHWALVWFVKLQ